MIVQHYTFRCDYPGCTEEAADVMPLAGYPEDPHVDLDTWPPRPKLPSGWHRIDAGIVCPKHPFVNLRTFVS